MTSYLFAVIPTPGHLNPMIGPAVHLHRRGHRVAITAPADVSPQIKRAGLPEFLPQGGDSIPPPSNADVEQLAALLTDPVRDRQRLTSLLLDRVEERIEPLRDIVRAWKPDVMVIDPMRYETAIVAHTEGLPWAGLSPSPCPTVPDDFDSNLERAVSEMSARRAAIFESHGMSPRFRSVDLISPHLAIAFTTPEFVGRSFDDLHLVGPSLPPGERGDQTGEFSLPDANGHRLVYMSLGTRLYFQPQIFQTVLDAVQGKPVQLIVSWGDLAERVPTMRVPDNAATYSYVPQLSLLPRVRALITHGGANSVMEALHHGVPLLISPICSDQPLQARYIRASNCGQVLDLATATPEQCWQAISSLLADDCPQREGAARLSHAFSRDGAERAATLLEELG